MKHHDAGKTTRDILNAKNVIKVLKIKDGNPQEPCRGKSSHFTS